MSHTMNKSAFTGIQGKGNNFRITIFIAAKTIYINIMLVSQSKCKRFFKELD